MEKNKRLLGEIMMSCGFISVEHVIRARYKQINSPQKKIGECLLEMGYINLHQSTYALNLQSQDQKSTANTQCFT